MRCDLPKALAVAADVDSDTLQKAIEHSSLDFTCSTLWQRC